MRRAVPLLMIAVLTLIAASSVAAVRTGTAVPSQAENRLPAEVVQYGGPAQPLSDRVAWANGQAAGSRSGPEYWVGYSVRRLMGERSTIGSFRHGGRSSELTVEEILAGKKRLAAQGPGDVRRTAKEVLDGLDRPAKPEAKVLKDVGIFLLYAKPGAPAPGDVVLSNLDLSVDFKGKPLFWAGPAGDGESLAFLQAAYGKSAAGSAKEELVAAIGIHGDAELVVPILERILTGADPDDLRKSAAFWMGQQNDAAGLRILVRAARSDKSEDVRDGAVFAVSQVELPEAVDELIALAGGAEKPDVRKKAVFWLGEKASVKAGKALEGLAMKDENAEVQEQAVFALSQLPDNQGVEPLIKLAKTHPDPRVRKKAIFWLGETGDPRALETLVSIIKGK